MYDLNGDWDISIQFIRGAAQHSRLAINWNVDIMGISGAEVETQLSAGEPRIELSSHTNGVSVMPYMMEEGEAEIVAARLSVVLNQAQK